MADAQSPSDPPSPLSPPSLPHNELLRKIQDQVAFYFSADNLQSDMYLVSQMDKDRWVPVDTIAQFSRVRTLTSDTELIIDALRGSTVVQLDEAARKLRPPKTNERNTIVIRNLGTSMDPQEIKAYFGEFQEGILNIKPEIGDNWFVDMRNEGLALEAIEHLRSQCAPDGMPLAVRIRSNNYLRGLPPKRYSHAPPVAANTTDSSSHTPSPEPYPLQSPEPYPLQAPDLAFLEPPAAAADLNYNTGRPRYWLNASGTFRSDAAELLVQAVGAGQVHGYPDGYAEGYTSNGYVYVEAHPPELHPQDQYQALDASSQIPATQSPEPTADTTTASQQTPPTKPRSPTGQNSSTRAAGPEAATLKAQPKSALRDQDRPAGVWSSVVSGSPADPRLAAMEQNRLDKAGLSMQKGLPGTQEDGSPHAPNVTPEPAPAEPAKSSPTGDAAPPSKSPAVTPELTRMPKPKPKSKSGRGSRGSSPKQSPKQSPEVPPQIVPVPKPKSPKQKAQHPLARKHPPKEFDREEWLQDTGWQVVGAAEPQSLPHPTKSNKHNIASMEAHQRSPPLTSPQTANKPSFSLAFADTEDESSFDLDRSDPVDSIELIDVASKARNTKSKRAKAKGSSKKSQELLLSKARPRSASELTKAWTQLMANGAKEHAVTIAWVLSPVVAIVFLYLFVFVL